ncbi:MAG: replication protein [candidate division TM6 bacterium GW2011_GWF2_37_49]|nr:MAG: replication protein [candidate division TM6 bacterium GW2011_GWF2_37_49]
MYKDFYIFHSYCVSPIIYNYSLTEQKIWNVLLFFAHKNLLTAEDHEIPLENLLIYLPSINKSIVLNKLNSMQGKRTHNPMEIYFEYIKIRDDHLCYQYPQHLRMFFSNKFELDLTIKLNSFEFTSRYSIFLYRLCYIFNLWSYLKLIPILCLRRYLGLKHTQYSDPKYFFNKVLVKALYEVNQKTDLIASVKPLKEGKTVIAFLINTKKKPESDLGKFSVEELTEGLVENITIFKAFFLLNENIVDLKTNFDVKKYVSQADRDIIYNMILVANNNKIQK